MDQKSKAVAPRIRCSECPLCALDSFREFTKPELSFISDFKTGELTADRGTTVLQEGAHSAHLFTVLKGWGFRYKILEDGRRQILNYVVPGDLIGLQGTLLGEMQHSVEALTPMTLCVFERGRLAELYSNHPDLAFDVTWIAAQEEQILDEHLLSVGRRTAMERAAYLLTFLNKRGNQTKLLTRHHCTIPITQQHVADTLGLSLVHTNKTLRKLAGRDLIKWREGGCEIIDGKALSEISGWEGDMPANRPFV